MGQWFLKPSMSSAWEQRQYCASWVFSVERKLFAGSPTPSGDGGCIRGWLKTHVVNFEVSPVDQDISIWLDGFIFSQTEMREGRVVGMESAAGFDLAHLVAFAIWPIADDEGAPEAEPIALFIDQLDRDAVSLGIVIGIDLERAI